MSKQELFWCYFVCFLVLAALSFAGREDYKAQRVIDVTPVVVLAVSR